MAYVLKDRVRQTSSTVGTGAIVVADAIDGYQTFATALANNDTTFVCCVDGSGNWQTFYATWAEGTGTLTRTTAVDGSAGLGVTVSFTGQAQVVFIADVAAKSQNPHFDTVSIGNTYSVPSSPRKYSFFQQTALTTGGAVYRIGGTVSGTISADLTGYYTTAIDSDTLKFSNTDDGMTLNYFGHNLAAGWSGGRTTHQDYLAVTGDGTAGAGSYIVSGASFVVVNGEGAGTSDAHRGNYFARNDYARLQSGAGYHNVSVFGNETDVGVDAGADVQWKGGIKIVQLDDDANRGWISDVAFGINNGYRVSGLPPGWLVGIGLGAYEGWWPFTSNSRLVARVETADSLLTGAPAAALGAGIDLTGITITETAFKSPGFAVSGAGVAGAVTTGGVALQTRSAITAKTGVVNTITVMDGGLYAGAITLTLSAPTTSGTTATASVATRSYPYVNTFGNRGTGYAEGDTITFSGGTFTTATSGIITKISSPGGEVFGVKLTTPGNYSVEPAYPISTTTSGSGTGLTINPIASILTVSVTNPGTNYSETLPPTITSSAATVNYRSATFKVTMTATQAALDLNPGGGLVITASALGNYANDAAAAAGGVAINGVYRNGSVLMVRVA